MDMDMNVPSDLNKVLANYTYATCTNVKCKKHMGIRHIELRSVNFCSMACFKGFPHHQHQAVPPVPVCNGTKSDQLTTTTVEVEASPQVQAVSQKAASPKAQAVSLSVCNGTKSDQLFTTEVKASPPAQIVSSQKPEKTIYYQQLAGAGDRPVLVRKSQPGLGVNVTRPLANNSANTSGTCFPKDLHNASAVTTTSQSQIKQEVGKTIYYQQRPAAAAVEVCKPAPAVQVQQPTEPNDVKLKYKRVTCHPGPSADALKSFGNYYDVKIGSVDSKRQVIPTHYNSMTDIYFQTPEMQNDLDQLQAVIQRLVERLLVEELELDDLKVGGACIAPYKGDFYRGIITNVKDDKINVFFMDYGNEETISRQEEIYELPEEFGKMPRLAIHGQWDLALSKEVSNDELLAMYDDETLTTKVLKKITDGQYLIRIGNRAPPATLRFIMTPGTIKYPEEELIYEEEF